MAKVPSEIYICSHCDAQSSKWQGRCSECGQWGTLSKVAAPAVTPGKNLPKVAAGKIVSFKDITVGTDARLKTGINEIDRVLGGGFVAGSLVLLGGEPGVGKSTLVLHICKTTPGEVLYVSGEESGEQIKHRLDRLDMDGSRLAYLGETNIETIIETIAQQKPALTIIDSIQTMSSAEAPGSAGSVNQVRICTTKLLDAAKKLNVTLLIIGHVTKFGEVAGPKTLEHLVDVVLYLEGDQHHGFRILRGAKNRFGSTAEVGVFEMTSSGLKEVRDPTGAFLSETKPVAGTVITAALEGSRIFFLEVQALVSQTSFGYPQRKSDGFDLNRLQLLIATLSRRIGLKLGNQDVFLNVAGGLHVSEPAIDLAVCLAIYSALKNKPAGPIVAFGEVGLTGEVRPVPQQDRRIGEALQRGFTKLIIPRATGNNKTNNGGINVSTVSEAIKIFDTPT